MKRIFYAVFIILAFFGFIFSQAGFADEKISSYNQIFYKANDFYQDGKFDQALLEYEKITDSGSESGNIYYNIGNCYFKKGEIGKSVLNYERAKRFMPRDSDLRANYEYAISKLPPGTAQVPQPLPMKIALRFYEQFTVDELTILLSVSYVFMLVIFASLLFVKTRRAYLAAGLVVILLFSALTFVTVKERVSVSDKEAVVLVAKADCKFEPLEQGTTHFEISEGLKVVVLDSKSGWSKIKRADGKIGWVDSSGLGII